MCLVRSFTSKFICNIQDIDIGEEILIDYGNDFGFAMKVKKSDDEEQLGDERKEIGSQAFEKESSQSIEEVPELIQMEEQEGIDLYLLFR